MVPPVPLTVFPTSLFLEVSRAVGSKKIDSIKKKKKNITFEIAYHGLLIKRQEILGHKTAVSRPGSRSRNNCLSLLVAELAQYSSRLNKIL